MSEVSAQILRFFRDLAARHGIAYAELAARIPGLDAIPPGLFARMSWDIYVSLWERFEGLVGPGEAIDDSGRLAIHSALSRPLQTIASGMTSTRTIYQAIVEWFGPSLFSCIDFSMEPLGGDRLRIVMEIQRPHRACPWFFRSARGALRALPTLLGQPEALVAAELGDRRAVFEVRPPPALRGWERVRRSLKSVRSLSAAVDELSAQQRRLNESHAALLRSQGDLERVIESLPDGVIIHRQGTIVFANPAFARSLTLTGPDLVVGSRLEDLAVEAERPALAAWLVADGAGAREFLFRRRDGATLTLELSAGQPVQLAGAPGLLVVARDVTERRQLELKLARADRLVALGTLAAGVAHEINNPLSYLILSLEAILREAKGTAPIDREALAQLGLTAHEGAERVRIIVGNLKTLSRGDDEALVATDLHAVLQWSIGVAEHQVRHRARIVRTFESVPAVLANEGRLGQVFLNLLINAAHSIREGQAAINEIRIVTRTSPAGDAIVEVEDTGAGIAAENLGRIFDPFFTTKPVGVGTGIGLSICHGIITGLGGDIEVESTPGQGSTFRVRLPAYAARPGVAPPPPAPTPAERPARILIVDDELPIADLLAQFLDSHQVEIVPRGREALEWLERDRFDVIFCDMMMPDLSGAELYETVRRRWPGLEQRFVFMTGGAFTTQARAFLDGVSNRCLEKPFDLGAVHEAIRALRPLDR